MPAGQVFGILNLGHWNLFEIWFLVLGIFMIFIKQVPYIRPITWLNDVALRYRHGSGYDLTLCFR